MPAGRSDPGRRDSLAGGEVENELLETQEKEVDEVSSQSLLAPQGSLDVGLKHVELPSMQEISSILGGEDPWRRKW